MKTGDIDELKKQLGEPLHDGRSGEEMMTGEDVEREQEARLVAGGALKMPEGAMDWDEFFQLSAGSVAREIAVEAVMESRGEW